eukprot:CAMPEP_0202417998 /NCGR_PEP_ID=MMETSP1128-20130828/44779_1 /ASSEMBLY_ACC=CAM_ASM_000463 /TAXON_ID=3047 /ORGANISM="Dunaliella tertiolecta, Strain CCMP1320" /LENGTH=556 /DNA_ID=CAMNT_0049025489 /DNA_START=87 /DNA_END=1755 /DNA_ORIENTATION=-
MAQQGKGMVVPPISNGATSGWRSQQKSSILLILLIASLSVLLGIAYIVTLAFSPAPLGAPPPESTLSDDALCSWGNLYLPEIVIPVRYDHNLSCSFDPLTNSPARAQGQTAIRLRASQSTTCVVLHAGENVDITSVELVSLDRVISGRVLKRNPSLQQVILTFVDGLLQPTEPGPSAGKTVDLRPKGVGPNGDEDEQKLPTLVLNYTYEIQPGLDGFYASEFTDAEGVRHPIFSTQFESIAARKALPCFDEPRFKARFAVVLSAPPAPFVVLSNMPLQSTRNRTDGLAEYTFEVSPPMSTYLLAWVIGELASVETVCETEYKSVPLRVWSSPDKVGMLGTALSVGCTALMTLSTTFGVPYALPKLDLVGIPNFAAGAMENWGVITYRETSLLVDPYVVPNDVHQDFRVALVVSHEIVHQWFGNLVTCADWSELWLNEGFATYFENLAAFAYRPSYGYFTKFFAQETVSALVDDAVSSHPLSGTPEPGALYSRVKSLAQVDAQFDGIEYDKGAAVIRMLRSYLMAVSKQAEESAAEMRAKPCRRRRRHLQQQQQQKQ